MAQHVLITTVITSVAANLVTKGETVNKVSKHSLFFTYERRTKDLYCAV